MDRLVLKLRQSVVVFVLIAASWWWITATKSGSWWWVALINTVPPQLLLIFSAALIWKAFLAKKFGLGFVVLICSLLFGISTVGYVLPRPKLNAAAPTKLLRIMTIRASSNYKDWPTKLIGYAASENIEVIAIQNALDKNGKPEQVYSDVKSIFSGWNVVQNEDLIIITKLAIIKSEIVPIVGTDRSLLMAKLRHGSKIITVLNASLPALHIAGGISGLPERINEDLQSRRYFQATVADIVRNNPEPIIMATELNCPPRGGVVNQLKYLHLKDAFVESSSGFGFTNHSIFGYARQDYIWIRGIKVESTSILPVMISSHRILTAAMSVE